MTTRSVIAIGKTGFGKSFILSHLLGQKNEGNTPIFVSKNDIESCTEEIESQTRLVSTSDGNSFNLTAFDTPGIADSKGRTRVFLDKIMSTIKNKQLNQILIFVKYGRFDSNLQNNFKVLNMCLNGLNSANCILIINQVPSQKKFMKENPNGSLQNEIGKIQAAVSMALSTSFTHTFAIENIEEPENSEVFQQQMLALRNLIYNTNEPFLNGQCQTWSQMICYYTDEISRVHSDESARRSAINQELKNQRDMIDKLVTDIQRIENDLENERGKKKAPWGTVLQIAAPIAAVFCPPAGAALLAGGLVWDHVEMQTTGDRIKDLNNLLAHKRRQLKELRENLANNENMNATKQNEFLESITKKTSAVAGLETLVK